MPRTKETKGRRLSRVMLTVLSAAIIAASVFIPAARAENPPMTVVYALDSANLTFRDSDAANINQINYAFALIRDGEAVGSHWAAIDRVFPVKTSMFPVYHRFGRIFRDTRLLRGCARLAIPTC